MIDDIIIEFCEFGMTKGKDKMTIPQQTLKLFAEFVINDRAKQLKLSRVINWVACKDKLPSHEEIILVYTYSGIDIYQFLDDQFYHYENGYVQNNVVTHWMPLPKPPCL